MRYTSLVATPLRLKNPKWSPGGPDQLLFNKFCSSTPFMSKVDDKRNKGGETEKKKRKKMMEIVATILLPVNCLTATNCNAAVYSNFEQ